MSTAPRPDRPVLTGDQVVALLQDTSPWLSCDECFERMDTYAEAAIHEPDDPDRADHADHPDDAMATHLRGCAACNEEAQSLIALLLGR